MSSISELEGQIRDFINEPRRQHVLFSNSTTWGMLCSSLDVIGDTELALEAYLAETQGAAEPAEKTRVADAGDLYLTLYGVLQVLFVQQDAVKHLAESLGIDYEHDSRVKEIRETRNDTIGHPTRRNKGKNRPEEFVFISRITLSRKGCELLTLRSDGTSDHRGIDVMKMVHTQREAVALALEGILEKLREDEMAHRRAFRDKKLADCFHSTLGYYHEKIGEALRGGLPHTFAHGLLESIQGYIDEFKGGLEERGSLEAYDSITYHLEELDHPMQELARFLSGDPDSKLNSKDAEVFHFFIREKLKVLIEIAREIDDEYSKDV